MKKQRNHPEWNGQENSPEKNNEADLFSLVDTKFKKEIIKILKELRKAIEDFPGGSVVKNPPANAGDMGLSPGPGRSHMLRST